MKPIFASTAWLLAIRTREGSSTEGVARATLSPQFNDLARDKRRWCYAPCVPLLVVQAPSTQPLV